jgi:fibrillarin-like pre-rRNA processing protein
MRPLPQHGLFEDRGFLWTRNRVPGRTVYGEKLRVRQGVEYRNWNPYRSKLAALVRNDPQTQLPDPKEDILYLGAASGTSVSHISDRQEGLVVAVEFSPRAVRDLVWNMEPRQNVVPVFEDAFHPERYAPYISRPVGALIQDVAQRHQVDIFLRNLPFVRKGGMGILFVKARSIHVAQPTATVYAGVAARLKEAGVDIRKQVDLEPFEKDHRAFVVAA